MTEDWLNVLLPYYGSSYDLCFCPLATELVEEGGRHPFAAFSPLVWEPLGPSWTEEDWISGRWISLSERLGLRSCGS